MRDFNEFLARRIIKKQNINKSRAKDLIEEANRKNNSLNKMLEKIGLTEDNSNDIIEYCYDILMSLIRAKLNSDGYKSSGESSHEAEISYLKKLNFSEIEIDFMDSLRYYRNGIKYYGKRFSKTYAKKVLIFKNVSVKKLKILVKIAK